MFLLVLVLCIQVGKEIASATVDGTVEWKDSLGTLALRRNGRGGIIL